MNEIVNKFSLAGDKFMPKMHLRQAICLTNQYLHLVFLYHYSKCKERIQKVRETGDSLHIY